MLRSFLAAVAIALSTAPQVRAQVCPADCNDDAEVAVNELVTCVGIVLAGGPTTGCPACDVDADGAVAINELIAGVNSVLNGCTPRDLPDLRPTSARFRSMTPACINDTSEIQLQLEVCIRNEGTADSGPFNVEVLGEPFGRVNGLAAGADACLRGPFVPFAIDVEADPDREVAERDELDNFDNFFVPQPSPPPFCSATETPTETPPATETPTAVDTDTPTPADTETATPIDTETPTPADTGNPTPSDTETPTATETPTSAPTTTLAPPCEGDLDCPLGSVCDDQDTCVTVTPTATPTDPGPPCGGDDDCLAGSACVAMVCLTATPTVTETPVP